MSSNGVGTQASQRHRIHYYRWLIRLLIAFLLGLVFALAFFSSGVVSR